MKKYFYLLAIWAVNFVACSDESANKGDSVIVNSSMEVERLVMNISKSFTSYTRGNIGEFVYPDYYGGMYTNDSGYPVVLIKGNMEKGKEDMIRRAGSDKFEVESCDYSFDELSELNSKLSDILCEGNFPDELTWNGVGIWVDKNRVSVDLEVCSEENIQLFKRLISNSPAIVFGYGTSIIIDSPVDSDNVNREESNVRSSVLINLGGKFSSYGVSNNNMYSGSIGVRGTHGEKSRFVTASHCIPKLTISGVVSDKEQKTISFCASKSDIQDAAELNLNIIDYIKMNDKVKEIRRASIIMSQYITLDKVNRKYSVDISETKALELGVNKMNYDRVVLEIENVNKLLVDNPDVELIDLKLQYKEYKDKFDSVFNR